MIILFKYCVDVENYESFRGFSKYCGDVKNCEGFRGFSFIYIYIYIYITKDISYF